MDHRKLIVYQKAFALSMKIHRLALNFPEDEKYLLCSQLRRSSRSVVSSIGEAYRKRQYIKHFISKLTDADMENNETLVWLEYAIACKYISDNDHAKLAAEQKEIGKLLGAMIKSPEKFLPLHLKKKN